MAEHAYCELTPHLWRIDRELVQRLGLSTQENATDPHHIFGGAGRRVDDRLNLLAVCRQVHDWAHGSLSDSRVLAVWLKIRSGYFDAMGFRSISGKWLDGWILGVNPSVPFVAMRDAIKEWAERKAGE